jgi:hypothetical protein
MVRGFFPRAEQDLVLTKLERSVVFLTHANVDSILLAEGFHRTAWDLANLYLSSVGADLLGDAAPNLVGLSQETTCFVSAEYFAERDPFADFVVHEAAHIFHNCKRRTLGLPRTSELIRRRWPILSARPPRRETVGKSSPRAARRRQLGG